MTRLLLPAQHELGDGRLARAGVAYDGRGLAAAQNKVQVAQGVLVGVLKAEARVVKAGDLVGVDGRELLAVSAAGDGSRGIGSWVLDCGIYVQDLVGARETRPGARNLQNWAIIMKNMMSMAYSTRADMEPICMA